MIAMLAGGLELAYDDVGTGVPLLFIHGWPHNRTLWAAQLNGLPTQARCLAPDLRGFGGSSVEPPYSIDQYADDLAAFLTMLGVERAVVCGLSMGGYVALALLRRHRALLRGLILTSTRATADTPEAVAANWEALKKAEKGRTSVTEGIPAALPALALVAKLQRKALAIGMVVPTVAEEAIRVAQGVSALAGADDGTDDTGPDAAGARPGGITDGEGGQADHAAEVGEVLFSLVNVARSLGVDPETALRARAASFRASIEDRG